MNDIKVKLGSAYRIRTGDLRLERAVSSTPRRMRHLENQPPEVWPVSLDSSPNYYLRKVS